MPTDRRSTVSLFACCVLLAVAACTDRPGSPNPLAPGDAGLRADAPTTNGKVKIKTLQLSSNTLNIDGPSVGGTASVSNSGPPLSGVVLLGQIVQGATVRMADSSVANCNSVPDGNLPNGGGCNMTFTASASDTANGTGTLVPGSAVFVLHVVQIVGGVETELANKSLDINLVASPTIATLVLSSTTLAIDGPLDTYTVTLQNPGGTLNGMLIQGYMEQGTTKHAAGGTLVTCGSAGGVLTPGTCTMTFTAGATNSNGTGTLVPGAATFELDLIMSSGSTRTVYDTKTVGVTLILDQPQITDVSLSSSQLVIGGSGVAYTATLDNPTGSSASGIRLQGWIVQGATRRAAGGSLANCSASAGVLPAGFCTMDLTATASNSAAGSGTLVPGAAVFELDLIQNNGTTDVTLDTKNENVTLLSGTPTITNVALATTYFVLDGTGSNYSVTANNPGSSLSTVFIQGWVTQGTARRAAGGDDANCGAGIGVLPNGTCVISGAFSASNSGSGSGTFVSGPATLVVQLVQEVSGVRTILDSALVTITIVPSTPSIMSLQLSTDTIPIEGSTPYTVTLYNPTGSPLSITIIQGEVVQGTTSRAGGGEQVSCGAGTGILPPGACTLSWEAVASNQNAGSGTLVAGDASFVLSLIQGTTTWDTKTVAVVLTTSP